MDSDGAPEAVLGLLHLAALQQKVGAHLQGLRVVGVHLERALTELFRELELTFVQQLVQAVNLLGNCLLLGKLVILGALLWFGFPYDGPCSQGAVTETLLMLVAT